MEQCKSFQCVKIIQGETNLKCSSLRQIEYATAKSLQSCPTLRNPLDGSSRGSTIPGILQARTLGCHFPLQCMKGKSESEIAQSCQTLSDPTDCSLPGSSMHGISRQEYWSGVPLPSPFKGLLSPMFWLGPESRVASRPQGI